MGRKLCRGGLAVAACLIVTVAAAYSWKYAWTPGQGYLSAAFNNSAPLTTQVPAIAVIIRSRVEIPSWNAAAMTSGSRSRNATPITA